MSHPRLDDQLCFALYSASRAVIAAQRPGLQELGLTYPQYLVMMVLWEEPGVPVGRICERLHLDSGTVSPLVRRLEQAGLVARRRSDVDERSVTVELTDAGRALSEKSGCVSAALAGAVAEIVDGEQEPSIDIAELGNLRTALHHLVDELDRVNGAASQKNSTQKNSTQKNP